MLPWGSATLHVCPSAWTLAQVASPACDLLAVEASLDESAVAKAFAAFAKHWRTCVMGPVKSGLQHYSAVGPTE